MEGDFSGYVIDPSKCSDLTLEQKRDLVHEVSQCAENASEILQSFGRRELLQLICAELGEERKYSGVPKQKMIAHLLKLVSSRNLSKCDKKDRIYSKICRNVACQATLKQEDRYCKRCSCCICYRYDDNKDPSLWLVCTSDPPYSNESCGMSCHLKCALTNDKMGFVKNGCYGKLDGSFYCVCCGKLNWLIGSWRKQVKTAKEARRVDILCERLILSHKILSDTEKYEELHSIINEAVKKLKKEIGPLDKVSTVMARGIVNRLACGAEVQKLCALALETLDSMLSSSFNCMVANSYPKLPGLHSFKIQFQEVSPTSVVISLQSKDECFEEAIIDCRIWHRSSKFQDYPEDPTFIVRRPETKFKLSGLSPCTEYYIKASPFSSTKELGKWEAKCLTSKYMKKEQEVHSDSQRGSTNTSDVHDAPKRTTDSTPQTQTPTKPNHPNKNDKRETEERQYEHCVKVIRWLEREGHMERDFRVGFLTWFSLKANSQERRVVSAFVDVLIDEPDSLVAQLVDAFTDCGTCGSKRQNVREDFCSMLRH